MAIATWPADLPIDPLIKGYEETLGASWGEFSAQSGAVVRYATTTDAPARDLRVSIPMTRAQVAVLETFIGVTLHNGILPFSFRHPRLGTDVKAYMAKDGGGEGQGRSGRITPIAGDEWLVHLQLIVLATGGGA